MYKPDFLWFAVSIPVSLIVGYFLGHRRSLEARIETIRALRDNAPRIYAAADRALTCPDTPPVVRAAILILLRAIADHPRDAAAFILRAAKARAGGANDDLESALRRLHGVRPEAADDARDAIIGLLTIVGSIGDRHGAITPGTRREAMFHPDVLISWLQRAIPA